MTFLKFTLLVIDALAALSLCLTLPWQSGPVLQNLAVALLGKSIALSLLFGLLHWLPLARRAKQAALATQGP